MTCLPQSPKILKSNLMIGHTTEEHCCVNFLQVSASLGKLPKRVKAISEVEGISPSISLIALTHFGNFHQCADPQGESSLVIMQHCVAQTHTCSVFTIWNIFVTIAIARGATPCDYPLKGHAPMHATQTLSTLNLDSVHSRGFPLKMSCNPKTACIARSNTKHFCSFNACHDSKIAP